MQMLLCRALPAAVASALIFTSTPARAADDPGSWPDISRPAKAEKDGGADSALIIAVEEYASLPRVPGAVENGTAWYRYLIDGRGVPEANVHFLKNGGATLERIRAAAELAATEAKELGRVWVVYIGHGGPARDGADGVLVGFDAQQDADSLYARSISQRELLDHVGKSMAEAVVVVDACFSGLANRVDSQTTPLAPGLMPTIPATLLYQSRATVLSAGKTHEFAGPLPGTKRPAFSYLVLGGLRGWADEDHDGNVTVAEVVSYARKSLAILPIRREQTPQFTAASPTLVLAKSATETGPRLSEIIARLDSPQPGQAAVVASPTAGTEERAETRASSVRWVGLGVAVVGAGLLAAGGVSALNASSKNDKSAPECPSNRCTPVGRSLREDALASGDRATWLVAGGLAATALGAGLFVFAPRIRVNAKSSTAAGVQFIPSMGGASVHGTF
jgi:hypothetical protein